ncbi:hypothetical protein AWB82_04209 [Caballeronia glebae]|uniref:GIY-YIG domain-containing protein n=1 Tax=Caballeronia glebae TaxID=1777143 RepID=A0A158BJQ0_9BURK|nr:hypothetical protein [Caballeronia glebae]SAK70302.1 hypothetical protein AWB82_04209 [Caballeronia glebae]
MATIEISAIEFPHWKKWANRERPSRNFDVPVGFGLLGIYVLATSEVDAGLSAEADRDLNEAVIYIGMSEHVERRLEQRHDAVDAYKQQSGDIAAENLRFTIWHSGAAKGQYERKAPVVAAATIAVYERVLLRQYAEKFGRLPRFNKL